MNAVYQSLDVSVAVGEFLGVERPIAHIILPAVVECDPHKSQALCRWKCVIYLLRLHRSAISPRAPDGTESIIGSCGCMEALFHHEAPVVGERPEVVSLVNRDEGAKGMETLSRVESDSFVEANSNFGVRGIGHGYGQGNQLG